MDLKLQIIKKVSAPNGKGYRAGKLFINEKYFSFTIEDEDRGLTQNMPLDQIKKIKIDGVTAIPTGKYQVAFTYSNRFGRLMMQVLNVSDYEGVRIHVANSSKDVEGCIGVAYEDSSDGFAGNSKQAVEDLEKIVREAEKTEKIWLVIVNS